MIAQLRRQAVVIPYIVHVTRINLLSKIILYKNERSIIMTIFLPTYYQNDLPFLSIGSESLHGILLGLSL